MGGPGDYTDVDLEAQRQSNLARVTGWATLFAFLKAEPGGGNGNPLQYSCPESPVDRGAWWAAVHGVARSQT